MNLEFKFITPKLGLDNCSYQVDELVEARVFRPVYRSLAIFNYQFRRYFSI